MIKGIEWRLASIEDSIGKWLEAVALQRERLSQGTFKTELTRLQIDAEFFTRAVANTVRAVGMTREMAADPVDAAISQFEAALPDWKKLRDVSEHFDEYLVGAGRLQKRRNFSADPIFFERGPGFVIHYGDLILDADIAVRELDRLVAVALDVVAIHRASIAQTA